MVKKKMPPKKCKPLKTPANAQMQEMQAEMLRFPQDTLALYPSLEDTKGHPKTPGCSNKSNLLFPPAYQAKARPAPAAPRSAAL